MNTNNEVIVPSAQRLRAAFAALVEYTRPATQLAPLIAELGEALEARIAAINSTNAAVVGRIENTLRGELTLLRVEIDGLRAVADTNKAALEVAQSAHEALNTKLHTVSNHIMAFENKLDELSEALTLYISEPDEATDSVTININTHSVDIQDASK